MRLRILLAVHTEENLTTTTMMENAKQTRNTRDTYTCFMYEGANGKKGIRVRDRKAIGQRRFSLVFGKPEANGACLRPGNVFWHTHKRQFIWKYTRMCVCEHAHKTFYGLIMSRAKRGGGEEYTRKYRNSQWRGVEKYGETYSGGFSGCPESWVSQAINGFRAITELKGIN